LVKKIIPRIKGGLGNQLFCYAAARRLALLNDAELGIDDVSGFAYDIVYKRRYQLDHFSIPCRKATAAERMEPFSRLRRYLKRSYNRRRPFEERSYIQQEGIGYDPRLLQVKPRGTVYLEGYWQSEDYFKDVEETIRKDLQIIPPTDADNQRMAEKIHSGNSVAMHMRWFDAPGGTVTHNLSADYYRRAIALMESKTESPHYFLISDDPEAALATVVLPEGRVTCISHNRGNENAYADLWLMTLCRHFITANSTFSWWGAWLGGGKEKIVSCPSMVIANDTITSWNFAGQIPSGWLKI
jgi:hypothetical protein